MPSFKHKAMPVGLVSPPRSRPRANWGDGHCRLTTRIPAELRHQIRLAATIARIPMEAWIMQAVGEALQRAAKGRRQ